MPGPVVHEFKACSTKLCRNAWGKDEQQTVWWLRARVRAREKLHLSSTAWPEPLSSRLHQGVTCLFIRTAVLCTCIPGGPGGEKLGCRVGWAPVPLESTSNLTRGKRRLKMRGSWRRWRPLEKPKEPSPGELELWRPKLSRPPSCSPFQARVRRSPCTSREPGGFLGKASGQNTPVGYQERQHRARQLIPPMPSRAYARHLVS